MQVNSAQRAETKQEVALVRALGDADDPEALGADLRRVGRWVLGLELLWVAVRLVEGAFADAAAFAAGAGLAALSWAALAYQLAQLARGKRPRRLAAISLLKLGLIFALSCLLVMICHARPRPLALGLCVGLALHPWALVLRVSQRAFRLAKTSNKG